MAPLLQEGLPTSFSFQIVARSWGMEKQVLREYRLLAHDVIRVAPISSFLELESRLLGLPVLSKPPVQIATDTYLQQLSFVSYDFIETWRRWHCGFDLAKSNFKTLFDHVVASIRALLPESKHYQGVMPRRKPKAFNHSLAI
jgi:hypothetical protein